jgi:hypothetical protein
MPIVIYGRVFADKWFLIIFSFFIFSNSKLYDDG